MLYPIELRARLAIIAHPAETHSRSLGRTEVSFTVHRILVPLPARFDGLPVSRTVSRWPLTP